ncbi:MAG: xylose isomerase, partial [Gammaproteobacteria bacterium]
MRMPEPAHGHLTYCSNIHPGETWPEVRANLGRFLPEVKRRVAPDRAFGVGLRLSAAAATALRQPPALEELKDFLRREGLYTFTVNAFPYGVFHGRRVKEDVYLPDWRDPERLRYTNEVADLLAETERAHANCQIGSYPFFREGRVGANFVIRSTDQAALA